MYTIDHVMHVQEVCENIVLFSSKYACMSPNCLRLLSPIYYVHVQNVLALRLRVHFRTSPHIAMSHVVMQHAAQPDSSM